jgi:hypothetical protein
MMTPFAAKQMLNFVAGGAAATRPTGRFVGLFDSASEISAVGYTRQSAQFGAASSPDAYASMVPTTFPAFTNSSPLTAVAVGVWDEVGNLWMSGALATARVIPANGGMVVNVLGVTLT